MLDVRTSTSMLVEVMLLSVLLFQDRFNGMIARKNTLAGTKEYHVAFGEDSYTVVTAATTSTFRYELTGGTVGEFKRFFKEKTGKMFRRVK